MDFEYQACGVFEGLEHHQEVESIYSTAFVSSVGLGDREKKLVS